MKLTGTPMVWGKDLTGRRFSRLVVLSYAGKTTNKKPEPVWFCRCDCGKELNVRGASLKKGCTKSCGCLLREHQKVAGKLYRRTHGFTADGFTRPIYAVWNSMVQRCTNPKAEKYALYGGRGIKVCDEWRTFAGFIKDMGDRPTDAHQIERKDNNGNYCPENCRWATRKEQGRNRRDNHILEFNGKKATLAEWAEITVIGYHTLKRRINVYGWTTERALTQPVRKLCRA